MPREEGGTLACDLPLNTNLCDQTKEWYLPESGMAEIAQCTTLRECIKSKNLC